MTKPTPPKSDNDGEVVELDALNLQEWESGQVTPQVADAKLDALVKRTAETTSVAAPPVARKTAVMPRALMKPAPPQPPGASGATDPDTVKKPTFATPAGGVPATPRTTPPAPPRSATPAAGVPARAVAPPTTPARIAATRALIATPAVEAAEDEGWSLPDAAEDDWSSLTVTKTPLPVPVAEAVPVARPATPATPPTPATQHTTRLPPPPPKGTGMKAAEPLPPAPQAPPPSTKPQMVIRTQPLPPIQQQPEPQPQPKPQPQPLVQPVMQATPPVVEAKPLPLPPPVVQADDAPIPVAHNERFEITDSHKRPRPRRKMIIIGAAVVAVVIVVVLIATRTKDEPVTAPEPPVATAPTPPPVEPPVEPPPVVTPEPAPTLPVVEPEPTGTGSGQRPIVPGDRTGRIRKSVVPAGDDPTPTPTPTRPPEDPSNRERAKAAYAAGNERLFAGDPAGAVRAYRESISLGYTAGYRGLGLAYAQQGDNAKALEALRTYVKAAPNAKDAEIIKKRITALESR